MKIKRKINLSLNMKIALGIASGFLLTLILIPVFFVLATAAEVEENDNYVEIESIEPAYEVENFYITVLRTERDEFETIEFERYIIGVVAAEMPALFELDALRAQAIAARTYAMRILEHENYILDTVMHQVFLDDDQLQERWGNDFDIHFATIEEAVNSTKGLVLTYDNELITPMFFAMSSGATENSEDVFSSARPYLRSVASPGYEDRSNFSVSERFTVEELREAFEDDNITRDNISILAHSEGGNVSEIKIGTQLYTGRQVREILGLRSAAFSISTSRRGVTFTTYGHGHGVGMSQHGANAMARLGYDYEEILQHFYQNVLIVEKNLIDSE